jgi:hypothetical protein
MYDHSCHAGNQGDVVKHVALIAALRIALEEGSRRLRYVDAFAGPSGSVLLPGGEWLRGIGSINRAASFKSPDVKAWFQWYLARPTVIGSRYPGSALIAADAATDAGKTLVMTLWDTSPEVVADLRNLFGNQAVVHAGVDANSRSICQADFLFVDPPGVASPAKPCFPEWPLLLRLMAQGRHMLAWLPVNVAVVRGATKVSARSESQLQEVRDLKGTAVTRVLWAHGGRTIGCYLVYRTTPKAVAVIQRAVAEVVSLCRWPRKEVHNFSECESVVV